MQTIKICEKTKERLLEDISVFLVSDRIKRKVFSIIDLPSNEYDSFISDAKKIKEALLKVSDIFTEIDHDKVLKVIRPIIICTVDDIKHTDDIFKKINPENWDAKVAVEFIRWNIIQSSELLDAWKTMPSILEDEITAVEEGLQELKRIIVLDEPDKSEEIKENIIQSFDDLCNEDIDKSREQILSQIEEISDGERIDIIIDVPFENNVIDFLENDSE